MLACFGDVKAWGRVYARDVTAPTPLRPLFGIRNGIVQERKRVRNLCIRQATRPRAHSPGRQKSCDESDDPGFE